MRIDLRSPVSVAILATVASAVGVVIVDAPGLGVLPSLASAIAAAAPGDVLLVAPGTYAPFVIDNKSISTFAMPGGVVSITGTIEVRNLGPAQRVALSGLEASGAMLPTRSGSGLRLDSNAGQVRVQRCAFNGGEGLLGTCTNNGAGTYGCIGGNGGDGIRSSGSVLAVYDSTVIEGAGGHYSSWGGDGGHALFQFDFGVIALSTRFENCRFAGNRAVGGGAIYSNGPSDISCCTFVENTAPSFSGGAVQSFRPVKLSNSIAWNNTAPNGAQLSATSSLAVFTVDRCYVQGGQAGVLTSSGGSLNWGVGNLSLVPMFVDEDDPDDDPTSYEDNDYRLLSTYPCVDSGDSSLVFADEFDLDLDGDVLEPTPYDLLGLARFHDTPTAPDTGVGRGAIVDMGCYEHQP